MTCQRLGLTEDWVHNVNQVAIPFASLEDAWEAILEMPHLQQVTIVDRTDVATSAERSTIKERIESIRPEVEVHYFIAKDRH